MKKYWVVFLLVLAACSDEQVKSDLPKKLEPIDLETLNSYLIFGHFYGECGGEACVENFLVTYAELREDSRDDFGNNREFDFTIDRTNKRDEVKDLWDMIPDALFASETVIGCPDCSDGGGIYIELKTEGVTQRWSIDKQRTPDNLVDFVNKVDAKIRLLQ